LTFTIESLQDRCKFLEVDYKQGEDTARIKLRPWTVGEDTLRVTIRDNFGTDFGGRDETYILIPVTITARSTGIDPYSDASISIYPNPTRNKIQINNPQNEFIEEVLLFDTMGRHVLKREYSKILSNIEFDLTEVNPGAYFLMIRTEQDELKKLLIKR
ncbi:MAG: T9SS type A sorting domain-containing protein, partial [Bacteroidales bacterium]